MIEVQELITKEGVWQVLKSGENICIVDHMGRERHRSRGHINTAMHLAMRLSDSKYGLPSEPNLDEALRLSVQQFKDEHAAQ